MSDFKQTRRPSLWAIVAAAAGIVIVVALNMDELPQLTAGRARLQTIAAAVAVAALLVGFCSMVLRRLSDR